MVILKWRTTWVTDVAIAAFKYICKFVKYILKSRLKLLVKPDMSAILTGKMIAEILPPKPTMASQSSLANTSSS